MSLLARSVDLLVRVLPLLLLSAAVCPAQGNEPRDHPLLTRLPQYEIHAYAKNYDAMAIPMSADKMESLAAGMDAYLTKPLDVTKLHAALQQAAARPDDE